MTGEAGRPFTPRVLSNEVEHDSGTEVFGKAELHVKSWS